MVVVEQLIWKLFSIFYTILYGSCFLFSTQFGKNESINGLKMNKNEHGWITINMEEMKIEMD